MQVEDIIYIRALMLLNPKNFLFNYLAENNSNVRKNFYKQAPFFKFP